MTTKDDCLAYLSHRAERGAEWREQLALKYPDKRNLKAAERLRAIAATLDISAELWPAIAPHYDEADPRWLDAVSTTNRDVVFRQRPKDSEGYLRNLISNLTH
jgi:hypothetical protein